MPKDLRVPRDVLKIENDEALLGGVLEHAFPQVDFYGSPEKLDRSSAPLTEGQRALFAIQWLVQEVCNGGFAQFFTNSTGILAAQAFDGLTLVGAKQYAEILRSAMAVFPGGVVPLDRDERDDQLGPTELHEDLFESLEARFYEDLRALYAAEAAYVRAHPDQFLLP